MAKTFKTASKIIDYIIENDIMDDETYKMILKQRIRYDHLKSILYLIKYKYNITPSIKDYNEANYLWGNTIIEMLGMTSIEKYFKYILDTKDQEYIDTYKSILEAMNTYGKLQVSKKNYDIMKENGFTNIEIEKVEEVKPNKITKKIK